MTEPERNLREVFRVSAAEKAAIKVLADLRGIKPGTYARLAALGQLPAMGSRPPAMPERQGQAQASPSAPTIEEPKQVTPLPPPAVNAGLTEAGEIVAIDRSQPMRVVVDRGSGVVDEIHGGPVHRLALSAPDPRIEAEVAEAKLEDEPARGAFIARRTRELYGQGKTTRLAESQAAEEWERRGL